jgi:thiamine-phosphate pyrophosphorylase
VLLEKLGLDLATVREELKSLTAAPAAPADDVLFLAARDWSLAHRHDPEFLTDAFLVAVLRYDAGFEAATAGIGLDVRRLQDRLCAEKHHPTLTGSEEPGGVFEVNPDRREIDAARILDANLNRAREAVRVVEDYCRFALDDRFLTHELKELRHAIGTIAGRLPAGLLQSARETEHDVGASVTVQGEYDRASPAHVALVNLKRLQEALRSLEEFAKFVAPGFGREFETLRYRTYTLERAIAIGTQARDRLAAARLYVLLNGSECAASLDWTIARAAAGGVNVVQLREKSLPDRELLARARDVRRWTRDAGVLFIVNDRPDIARLAESDGVHLGQHDLAVADARRIVGPDLLIGVSTHSIEQVRRAVLDGADYLGVGPVFASKTKEFEELAGLEFVAAAARETTLPAFALGGIEPANVERVVAAGARRIAVSAAIARADDPELAARSLRAALD